jgi:dTDP-4-amino-4,6-dideoxygalactose transaminase
MHQAGWGVQLHYIPVYLHPYYQNLGFRPGDYPEAESYYASAMSLPLHCELSAEDQINVCRDLRHILGE